MDLALKLHFFGGIGIKSILPSLLDDYKNINFGEQQPKELRVINIISQLFVNKVFRLPGGLFKRKFAPFKTNYECYTRRFDSEVCRSNHPLY
jgi:hypothetical protein